MAADDDKRSVIRVKSDRRQVRPLPVVLPPLVDELLSSWIDRHAAFLGVSGPRLLRHCLVEVRSVRDLDLTLTRRDVGVLADLLRSSPHLIRNMTQWHGGKVRSQLVAVRRPSQVCQPCARRHDAHPVTRGARLRSWMEGWRVSCPVCGTALEDFSLYMRLFRADPADALLVSIERSARVGEQIMDRAFRRRDAGWAHTVLMRSLLLPQAPRSGMAVTTIPAPRVLDLVVPGADDFFQRVRPENLSRSYRLLPLSVRIPVLAGVAQVLSLPERWIDTLVGAVAPPNQASLLQCFRALESSDLDRAPSLTPPYSQILRQ